MAQPTALRATRAMSVRLARSSRPDKSAAGLRDRQTAPWMVSNVPRVSTALMGQRRSLRAQQAGTPKRPGARQRRSAMRVHPAHSKMPRVRPAARPVEVAQLLMRVPCSAPASETTALSRALTARACANLVTSSSMKLSRRALKTASSTAKKRSLNGVRLGLRTTRPASV